MTNVLLTHRGVIAATDEQFVHTLSVVTPETDLALIASDAMTSFQTAWNAGLTGLSSLFGDMADYTGVGAAEILDLFSGTLSAAAIAPFVAPAPSGTGNTGALQITMCVSLTAGSRPNGTPVRGRFYLPVMASTAVSDGVITATQQTTISEFVEAWFVELNARGLAPSVWSRQFIGPIPGPPAGAIQAVTSARIGRVADTIRSRRNGLSEAPYVDIPV